MEPTLVEPFVILHYNGRLLAWLGWKWMEVANILAYYDTATITAVKSFYSADHSFALDTSKFFAFLKLKKKF